MNKPEPSRSDRNFKPGEDTFRALFENAPEAMLLLDGQAFVDCNPATLRLMGGATREQVISLSPDCLSPRYQPDGRLSSEKYMEMVQAAYEKGSHLFEWVYLRPDGTEQPIEVSMTVVPYGDRQALFAIWRDLSHQAKTAVEETETKFRKVIEASPLGMHFYRLHPDGRLVLEDTNPGADELLHITHSPLIGKTIEEAFPNLVETEVPAIYRRLASEGGLWRTDQIVYNGGEIAGAFEVVAFQTSQGSMVATFTDIADRLRTEQTMRASEERYRRLFDNQQDGIFMVQDGKIKVVNRAMGEMIGYETDELIELPFAEVVAPEELAMVAENNRRRMADEPVPDEYHFHLLHKDRQTRVLVNIKATTAEYQGQLAVMGTIRNITQNTLAEAERSRLISILEATADFVGTSDMAGHLSYMNAAGRRMIGIGPDEDLSGYMMPQVSPPWANEIIFSQALPMVAQGKVWYGESALLSKDGREIPILQSVTPHMNAAGQLEYLSSIGRDISDRKKLEQQLQEMAARRGYQVQVSTQIAQEIATAPELNELFRRVVTLVKERLGYYHTQLLRYEPALNAVVLMTGYGEIGEKMQAAGHRMEMGRGLIGVAAATGQTVIRPDVTLDPDWRPNELLPETRGEIAVPIKFGDQILGVLDVQSAQAGALTEEDQQMLEGLCGQIAIAIDGTRLRQEMEQRLNELNTLYRATSREGWQSFLSSNEITKEYAYDRVNVRPAKDIWTDGMEKAVVENQLVVSNEKEPVAVAPLSVRGEVIGALGIYDDPKSPMRSEELDLIEQVSEQVALALESARLFEQTRVALSESEHQAHNLELLNQMGEATNKSGNAREAIDTVCRYTQELMDVEWISAALVDPSNVSFEVFTLAGLEGAISEGEHLPIQNTAIGLAIRENRVVITPNDVRADEYQDTRTLLDAGIRATMSVPLASANRVIGAINVGMKKGAFDQQDRSILMQIAGVLASSLENRRLFEQIQRTLVDTEKMYNFSRRLTAAKDLSEITSIVAETMNLPAINRAVLATFEYNSQHELVGAVVRGSWYSGRGTPPMEIGQVLNERLIKEGFSQILVREPVFFDDIPDGAMSAQNIRATVNMPLWAGDHQLGVIILISEQPNTFSDEERRLAAPLTQQTAIAVQTRLLFEQVAASEARFRDISMSSADWLWEMDAQGKFTFLSDRVTAVLGYTVEEMLGKSPADFIVAEDLVTTRQAFVNIMAKRQPIEELEARNLTKAGHTRVTATSGVPVLDGQGNLLGYRGVARDITDRREAEIVLEDQRRTLQAVLDNMAAGVFMVEAPSGRPILSNTRAEEFLGRGISPNASGDSLNQVYQAYKYGTDELYPPEEMPIVAGLTGQAKMIDDMEVRRPDGSSVLLQVNGSPVYDSTGRVAACVVVFQDITQQREAQETIRKRAAELATVSEVATAVSTILSPDEMLQTVVDMTRSSFDLYHTHIYLLNDEGDTLVLTRGAGETGRRMVAEGRQIALSAEKSLVARAARSREGVIVNNVHAEPAFLPHPLLPNTRSEMAVPMLVGDRLLGVLDVQDDVIDRFTEEDLLIQSTLAAQVAVALQNARQYAQVQSSGQLVRTVIDATPDWIFVKDLEHRFQLVNKGYCDAVHLQPEDLIGKNDFELGFPEELLKGNPEKGIPGFWDVDAKVMETGESHFSASDLIEVDGKMHVFNSYKTPLKGPDGRVIGLLAFSHDVTDREELLRDLESQQRTLQAVLDNMAAGVFMVEAPSGRPILSNARAEEFLGRGISPKATSEDLNQVYQAYKYGTGELYPPEEMPIVAGLYGQSKMIDDMEVLRPDGSRVLLQVNGSPVYDSTGKVVACVVVFQDITEKHKAAEELQKNQAQLAEALSIGKMGYWEFDVERDVYIFNDQIYKVLGVTAEEVGGYEISQPAYAGKFIPNNVDLEKSAEEMRKAVETSDTNYLREIEQPFKRGDGTIGHQVIRFRAVKDAQGRTVRLTGTNQDVTEQRKAQETIAKRAVELATVAEVATTVSTIQTPEEMLQTVVDLTKQAFALYHAHVYLLDEASNSLVLTKGAGQVGRQMVAEGRAIPVNTEKSLVARAARVRQGVIVNDVLQDPDFLPHPLLPGTRSEMAVPMIVGDSVLGVIDIQDEQLDRFTPEDINIMTTLAAQVAVSLQNARSFARAQRQAEREALINAISERIQSTNSVESALQVAVRELGRALGARRTAVQLGLNDQEKDQP